MMYESGRSHISAASNSVSAKISTNAGSLRSCVGIFCSSLTPVRATTGKPLRTIVSLSAVTAIGSRGARRSAAGADRSPSQQWLAGNGGEIDPTVTVSRAATFEIVG